MRAQADEEPRSPSSREWETTKIHRLRGKLVRTLTVGEDGVVSTFDTRTKRETNRWAASSVLSCSGGDDDGEVRLTVRKGKGKEVMQFALSAAGEAGELLDALQAVAARADGAADVAAAAPDGEVATKVRAAAETACLTLGHADAAAPKSGGGRRRSRFLEVKGMLVEQFGADVVEEQQAVWGGVLVSERKERFSLRAESISSGTLDLVAEDFPRAAKTGARSDGVGDSGGGDASPPPPSPAAQPAAAAESEADGSAAADE